MTLIDVELLQVICKSKKIYEQTCNMNQWCDGQAELAIHVRHIEPIDTAIKTNTMQMKSELYTFQELRHKLRMLEKTVMAVRDSWMNCSCETHQPTVPF